MKENILLVDGMNVLLRCFCAINITNDDGEHYGVVFGAINSLRKAIETLQPDRVIFAWEGCGSSERRKKLFSGYKEGRGRTRLTTFPCFKDIDDERKSLLFQIKRFAKYLEILPVTEVRVDGLEADDVIAYICTKLKTPNQSFVILSTDKDYLQLSSSDIYVYNPIKELKITESVMKSQYSCGIPPKNFAIARALVGDSSDRIPGVPGIGVKTAAKVIPELLSETKINVEDVINLAKERTSTKLKSYQTIVDHADIIKRNYILMQLYDIMIEPDQVRQIMNVMESKSKLFNVQKLTQMFMQDRLWRNIRNIASFESAFLRLHGKSMMRNRIL